MTEPAFQMEEELRKSTANKDTPSTKSPENRLEGATADKPEATASTGKGDNLDDLFSTLKQQISTSDWLKENTAEKWVSDNPELAKDYMDAAKGTK